MALSVRGLWEVDRDGARDIVAAVQARFAGAGFPVPIRLWDGTEMGPDDAPFRVVLHHPWSLRAIVIPGTDLATGEAFVFDAYDIEGSIVAALHTVAQLQQHSLGWRDRLGLMKDVLRLPTPPPRSDWRQARLEGDLHSRERDAEAIRFHYDVGNDFYRLFLDEQLVYSCAYFSGDDLEAPVDPASRALERAQERKLDLICRKLDLRPDDRLLDIGCGWGSLLLHAAKHYGVEALGVTLSQKQAELGRKRIVEAGLADRVRIRLRDYREVSGQFDAIASIGMVEHVGADHLSGYFDTAYALTAPGGRFLNQGITTGLRNEVRDMDEAEDSFVARYVFPDGALVPAWRAVRHMQDAGFEVHDLEQLRPHYARTLRHWTARLQAHADEAREAAGDIAYRIWRAYMAGSVVGFETGDLGVVQVLGSRPAGRPVNLPAGRAWMQPQRP